MKKKESKFGDIIISGNNPEEVPIGWVEESSSPNFKKGEYVILTTGADIVNIHGVEYRIYKDDMVIGKVELTKEERDEYEYKTCTIGI